jgi:hypothetical protein
MGCQLREAGSITSGRISHTQRSLTAVDLPASFIRLGGFRFLDQSRRFAPIGSASAQRQRSTADDFSLGLLARVSAAVVRCDVFRAFTTAAVALSNGASITMTATVPVARVALSSRLCNEISIRL